MTVSVRIPTTLRTLTAGQAHVAVEGKSVREVLGRCTHVLDLHTGSQRRTNLPQVRGRIAEPETRRMAEAFAASLNAVAIRGTPFYFPESFPEVLPSVPGSEPGNDPAPQSPPPAVTVTSILGNGRGAMAIVNGRVRRAGDEVAPGWAVRSIDAQAGLVTVFSLADPRRSLVVRVYDPSQGRGTR